MVDVVTEVEFSEWNELFVYTLDTTKAMDENFRQAISDIDQHRQHVQEYVSSLPDGEAFLEKLRKLSPVWSRRILIVEENFAVARMLEALAMDDAEVLIASNGEEGFALIEKGHFDLVVSEVELPNMNGIEMYNKAVAVDPALEGRFVFFTSTENPEHLSYLCSLNAIVLPKPSPVKSICKAIDEILIASKSAQDKTIH
jgi:CheY-like chemotaxis protein